MKKIKPMCGKWTLPDFPEYVYVENVLFQKAAYQFPYKGVIEQYRAHTPKFSRHLHVLTNRQFVINHIDTFNPDKGYPVEHLLVDTPVGKFLGALALLGIVCLLLKK